MTALHNCHHMTWNMFGVGLTVCVVDCSPSQPHDPYCLILPHAPRHFYNPKSRFRCDVAVGWRDDIWQSSHGNTLIESMSRSQIVSMVSLCAFPAIVVLVLVTVSIQMDFPSVDFVTVSVWLFEHEIQFIEQQRVKVLVQTKFKLDLNLGGGVQSFFLKC